MFDQILTIANSMVTAFLHIWPYLLLTIPLAVAVQMSGASKYISRSLQARPIVAVFLATAVGAFSPFCSCGVIPVVAALLISGVPLAPVMSFWIASPSMDPEAFFLSVATIGWELAVWRLLATLILSLSAGLLTHFLEQQGWLGRQILNTRQTTWAQSAWTLVKKGWRRLEYNLSILPPLSVIASGSTLSPELACCPAAEISMTNSRQPTVATTPVPAPSCGNSCGPTKGINCSGEPLPFWHRLLKETWSATLMVTKFMALAFFLNALITLHVPQDWVAGLLGRQNPWAILTAALLGVPAYASNLTTLPMVGSLLAQGMNPAAALAFLIAGPTTTLPAMAAVRGLASRRVFALYVSFSLVGAVAIGYTYSLVASLL
ncbi:MAG: permease [Anaerolineae bacterium]|nr:MAG: permease [Anaerolineae bacterium]